MSAFSFKGAHKVRVNAPQVFAHGVKPNSPYRQREASILYRFRFGRAKNAPL